jgi:predicted DNA-binding transcriptional regulator AlpA
MWVATRDDLFVWRAMTEKLQDSLAYPPRAMRAERAAAYLPISPSCSLKLVSEGMMPSHIRIKGMTMWDRLELDAALEDLKEREASRGNPIETHYGINK